MNTIAYRIFLFRSKVLYVTVALHNEDNEELGSDGTRYHIQQTAIHPGRDRSVFANDIAIVTLTTRIAYTPTVRPVCIARLDTALTNKVLINKYGLFTTGELQTKLSISEYLLSVKFC